MNGVGGVGQDHERVAAGVVQRIEGGERCPARRLRRCVRAGRRSRPRPERPSISSTPAGVRLPLAERQRLIEQGQAVADRAFGGARDQRQRALVGGMAFLLQDAREMALKQRRIDAAQVEALAAATGS